MKASVVISAYQPDANLPKLVDGIKQACPLASPASIIVVDDGSAGCEQYFAQAAEKGATVLHHEHNRGKGAAEKTGIAYAAEQGYVTAVTADCDGQHSPQDIAALIAAAEANPHALILGVRSFADMPLKSRMGNSIIRGLFRIKCGYRVSDVETGLRAYPLEKADQILAIEDEGYEFDVAIIARAKRIFGTVEEVPIHTIYGGGTGESHFDPVKDSIRALRALMQS